MINIEKLYKNACKVLRHACDRLEGDGSEFYKKVTEDPEKWLRCNYISDVTDALEIWNMAHEELCKSKGGSVYSALKRIVKSADKGYRSDIQGAWLDSEGRQCVCDGYRAVRLKNPVAGLKEARGLDLTEIMNIEPQPTTLELPAPGEMKAYIADPTSRRKSDGTVLYDFGLGLPLVDAKFLKDMMDIFPDAVVTCDGLVKPLVFKSDAGDGILLPVRKTEVTA